MTEITKYKPLTGELALWPIKVKDEYKEKWNEHLADFVFLTKDGEIVNEVLYRVGGWGVDLKADYFMLLKYTEAYYPDDITTDPKRKPHLQGNWVIIDKHGNEKVQFKPFDSPNLIKDSCIYSLKSNYYNIEMGEFYGRAFTSIASSEYLFIDKAYDDDKEKRGVLMINKKDGSTILYK